MSAKPLARRDFQLIKNYDYNEFIASSMATYEFIHSYR